MTRNQERANRALKTINYFVISEAGDDMMKALEADRQEALIDFLTNFMHLTDHEFVGKALQMAETHYHVERECQGCNGGIDDLEQLCDVCIGDPACIRGGG